MVKGWRVFEELSERGFENRRIIKGTNLHHKRGWKFRALGCKRRATVRAKQACTSRFNIGSRKCLRLALHETKAVIG